MGQWITLNTPAGHIAGWRADPPIPAKGVLVVVQEIFGVNHHIRGVVDRFASHGYVAVAPAFFDHIERGVELDYTPEGVERGREFAAALGFNRVLGDIEAVARQFQHLGKVGVVGYCWGGTVAFLANTRLGFPAVSYYGGRTVPFLHERLDAPMMFHFGERDPIIPPEHLQRHRELQSLAEIHVYPAGHGFNCEQRDDYDEPSARLALERTLSFFQRTLKRAGPAAEL